MSLVPDDPMQNAFAMALLLPLHQTPMDPAEIAVRGRPCTASLGSCVRPTSCAADAAPMPSERVRHPGCWGILSAARGQ